VFPVFFHFILWSSLIAWVLFADKSRWRSLSVISLIAMLLAFTAQILAQRYPVWDFVGYEHWHFVTLANGVMYMVATWMFIQWYPVGRKPTWTAAYWLTWTTFAVIIEFVYIQTGHMIHTPRWNLGYSYIADWLLFGSLHWFYRIFYLTRLDNK
jgi:hypothetical protein